MRAVSRIHPAPVVHLTSANEGDEQCVPYEGQTQDAAGNQHSHAQTLKCSDDSALTILTAGRTVNGGGTVYLYEGASHAPQ